MTAVVESDTLKITEGSTAIYSVTLVDENDVPIPKSDIDSIQLTYKDDLTGAAINNRTDQNVLDANNGVMGATDGVFQWSIQPADAVVVNSNLRYETHSAVLTWIWDSGTKQGRHEFYVQVENVGRTCWQNFINRVALRVGAGRRTLEMTDDHWCEAVSQSMDLLNTYLFRPEWAHLGEIAVANTVVKFNDQSGSPSTFDPNLRSVVRVLFHDPNASAAKVGDDPFLLTTRIIGAGYSGGYGGRYGHMAPAGRTGFGDIAFWQQHDEAVNRLVGNEPDWLWDEANRQLAISIPDQGPYEVTYLKAYSYTPNNLPTGYFNYFLKALEGYARLMLADIRGKFGQQIPGPTGGTETDASTQQQKGEALIQSVEETLRNLPLQATPEFG